MKIFIFLKNAVSATPRLGGGMIRALGGWLFYCRQVICHTSTSSQQHATIVLSGENVARACTWRAGAMLGKFAKVGVAVHLLQGSHPSTNRQVWVLSQGTCFASRWGRGWDWRHCVWLHKRNPRGLHWFDMAGQMVALHGQRNLFWPICKLLHPPMQFEHLCPSLVIDPIWNNYVEVFEEQSGHNIRWSTRVISWHFYVLARCEIGAPCQVWPSGGRWPRLEMKQLRRRVIGDRG